MLFWKRAALPFAAAVGLVVLALAMDGIIVVVASESCFRVFIDVKRISIFLDCRIFLNYQYIFSCDSSSFSFIIILLLFKKK